MEIRVYPDEVLKRKAEKVSEFGEDLARTADAMVETMLRNRGIGLAGNQVGILKRIIVVDFGVREKNRKEKPVVLINPEIVAMEGEDYAEEGCLSFPGLYKKVKRAFYVKVKAQNLAGEDVEFEGEGLLARIFQHEIDHLNGIVFIDRLSPLQRRLALEKYKKLRREKKAGRR